MTGDELARAYVEKASARYAALEVLAQRGANSDVVREAQELVELVCKAALRLVGIDPPRVHDVGPILRDHAEAFPAWFAEQIPQLAAISAWLRRERELALYGDVDMIPTKAYSDADARRAMDDAATTLHAIERLLAERDAQNDA